MIEKPKKRIHDPSTHFDGFQQSQEDKVYNEGLEIMNAWWEIQEIKSNPLERAVFDYLNEIDPDKVAEIIKEYELKEQRERCLCGTMGGRKVCLIHKFNG